MKTVTLKNGIVLQDNRDINQGLWMLNNRKKYCSLQYSKLVGKFYITLYSFYIEEENVSEFLKELTEMTEALKDANEYLKNN